MADDGNSFHLDVRGVDGHWQASDMGACSLRSSPDARRLTPIHVGADDTDANEPLVQVPRDDFACLLSCRANKLLERMAREIEEHEAKSALSRLLAHTIAAGHSAEAEAIQTAMHWAPAVVAGDITERELVRRLDWIVWPELMAAAVANYREILCNMARRWAGAIVNGHAVEKSVIEHLGVPADVVGATVNAYERAYGRSPCGRSSRSVKP
jgi:hypothetical protein